jgi:hypothetical protein|tara:strand:+ start:493 stop:792 length:300 start_codon:yes stop_codon:yes gene_type:complete
MTTQSHERNPETFKEKKGMEFALDIYHDLDNVSQVQGEIEKIKSLSKALIDLVENANISTMDQVHILQNTTLRVIYKNALEYLNFKEYEVKNQMCEDMK